MAISSYLCKELATRKAMEGKRKEIDSICDVIRSTHIYISSIHGVID